MARLRGILWSKARVLSELEVRVPTLVSSPHLFVAREARCDGKLLARKIQICQRSAGLRLDKTSHPDGCTKNGLTVARLVPPSLGTKWAEQGAVPPVRADGKRVQAQRPQSVTQFP